MNPSEATTLGLALWWMQDRSDRLVLRWAGEAWDCNWDTRGLWFNGRGADPWLAVRNCLESAGELRSCLAAVGREVGETEARPR
jgi:hypothetical protein